jgi:hypothetical protein
VWGFYGGENIAERPSAKPWFFSEQQLDRWTTNAQWSVRRDSKPRSLVEHLCVAGRLDVLKTLRPSAKAGDGLIRG